MSVLGVVGIVICVFIGISILGGIFIWLLNVISESMKH